MVPSAIASEMTTAIRDFGTGVESQRAKIVRDMQMPAHQVPGLIAFALRVSSSLLDVERKHDHVIAEQAMVEQAIVDKHLTRC